MSRWHALEDQINQDHPLYFWLACQHSLTDELARFLSTEIQVRVLKEYKCKIKKSEAKLLQLSDDEREQTGIARDIILECQSVPYIGARTIMPEATWNACQLASLGNTPIGTLLFNNPNNSQRDIEVQSHQRLDFSSWSDFAAIQEDNKQAIWVRRSRFELDQKPIIIHELFSDRLLK